MVEHLGTCKRRVEEAETMLSQVRAYRDEQIKEACSHLLTEREAAEAAGVSPSYAHRAAKHGAFARVLR
jgi:hypothetical protein